MTIVDCRLSDVSGKAIAGAIYVRPITYTPNGEAIIAPEAVKFPIAKSGTGVNLAPGDARIVVETGRARHGANIVVPASGPVSLSSLIGA